MIIVKLGGSLFHSPLLQGWLDKLTQLSKTESIIIVPGGGPFADLVRQAQRQHHIDDGYAHHMALLAMSQFGLLLLGRCRQARPYYYPTDTDDNDQDALSIWLPDSRLLSESLDQSWHVTSDSLSLWLAKQLNANKLTLLKHQRQPRSSSINQLIEQGSLDAGFSAQYAQAEVAIEIFDVTQAADYALGQPIERLMP